MRRIAIRRVFCTVAWIWLIYILIAIYTSSLVLITQLAESIPSIRPPASNVVIQEPVDVFVDRTTVCDRWSRGLLKSEELNATLIYACERWSAAQRNFFRLRNETVNSFDASRLTISGENICTNDTFMIILIHSLHKYQDRRNAIRLTWGGASVSGRWPLPHSTASGYRYDPMNSTQIRLAFIFGQLLSDTQAEINLRQESDHYGDIIQGQFAESYRNMTLKSLTGLHWVSKYCPSAKFLFKCDDDMFVNVPAILDAIKSENMTRAIMGPYNTGSRVYRKGKWAISVSDYPFYYYPPYESGSGYVISSDLWHPLLNASNYVPHIFIDDVYITGILGRIVGARHVTRNGFAYATSKAPASCAIINGTVLTGTHVNPNRQYLIWTDLSYNAAKC